MTSAWPVAPGVLVGQVRVLAEEMGCWPSQRQVMRACRVGAPRAGEALAQLRASGFDPTRPHLAVVRERPDIPPAETAALVEDEPTLAVPAVEAVESVAAGDEQAPADAAAVTAAAPGPAGGCDGQPATLPGPVALAQAGTATGARADGQVSPVAETPGNTPGRRRAVVARWPLWVISLGAFVAIWGGWVGLGELVGFGPIRLLPGIADGFVVNSAITLPLGVEAYAAYALRAWLAGPNTPISAIARRFAAISALGALVLGAAGQIAYHLMVAAGITHAPWPITAFVSCLPVVVLGCGAALAHLIHRTGEDPQ